MIEGVGMNVRRSFTYCLAALIVSCTTSSFGQEPSDSRPGMYTGVVSCASTGCHGSPAPVANANVSMNEYDSWLHAPGPTHVKAYEVLHNAKSAVIAKNLRLGKPAWQAPICLDCHATNVATELQLNPIELADGVQCESCHGPAGGWRAQHTEDNWTHEKSVEAGMIDLRDIGVRSKVCLGCHMGDESRGVDHDLIAAGHPILTFELDNYTESRLMPPHWKRAWEKPEDASYREDTHGANAWALGQIQMFEEGLRLLARQARSERWPEFSALSCAACHHGLRTGAWRQERGYDGRPGVAPWSPARWAVLRHLVSTVASDQARALDEDIRRLARQVSSMRQPEAVAETADAIAAKLPAFERAIGDVSWNEKNLRALMRSIASDGAYLREHERQSAEQATFALMSLSTHLVRVDPDLMRSEIVSSVDELYKTLDRSRFPDEFDHDAFLEVLGRLEKQLR